MHHAYIYENGEIHGIDKAQESALLAAGLIEWGDVENVEEHARWSIVDGKTIDDVLDCLLDIVQVTP